MDKELSTGYKALLYIKECAELVGLEVIEGKTAFDVIFMAEIMKRLREEREPKWIPVSERLPEERDWYLAVFKEKDTGYQLIPRVAECINDENNWRMIDEEAFSKEYLDILECVAWMPLPEPYKSESEVAE